MTDRATIREATADDLETVAALIDEYVDWMVASRLIPVREPNDFRGATAPAAYTSPRGFVLLATLDDVPAGCVALRSLAEPGVCEMKKLYVRPEFRSAGVGRLLVDEVITRSRAAGYRMMRLDTLPRMTDAIRMYTRYGFTARGPYHGEHPAGALYFERAL